MSGLGKDGLLALSFERWTQPRTDKTFADIHGDKVIYAGVIVGHERRMAISRTNLTSLVRSVVVCMVHKRINLAQWFSTFVGPRAVFKNIR